MCVLVIAGMYHACQVECTILWACLLLQAAHGEMDEEMRFTWCHPARFDNDFRLEWSIS